MLCPSNEELLLAPSGLSYVVAPPGGFLKPPALREADYSPQRHKGHKEQQKETFVPLCAFVVQKR